jgi:hypothetical protein
MISRLTAHAVIFAILGTASLAFAASLQQDMSGTGAATTAATTSAKPVRIIQLERVVITAKRLPQAGS